jgi:hypothetical protein
MEAIKKLRRSGMDTAALVAGIGCKAPLIYMYENGRRFPSKRNFVCIVELAESRGLTLLARDFIADNEKCESDS